MRYALGVGALLLMLTAAALFGVMKVQDASEASRSAQKAGESLKAAAGMRTGAERVRAMSANITSSSAPSLITEADSVIKSFIGSGDLSVRAKECADALNDFRRSLDMGSEQADAARTLAEAAVNSLRELRETVLTARNASAAPHTESAPPRVSPAESGDIGAERQQMAEGMRNLLSAISRRSAEDNARPLRGFTADGGLIRFMRTTDDITANVNMVLGMCDAERAKRSGRSVGYNDAAELAEAALAGCEELSLQSIGNPRSGPLGSSLSGAEDGNITDKVDECRALLTDLISCIKTLAEYQRTSDEAASRFRASALSLGAEADRIYAEAESDFGAAMTSQADGINSAFFPPAFMLVAAAAGVLTILVTAFKKAVATWRGMGAEFDEHSGSGPLVVSPAPPPSIAATAASAEKTDSTTERELLEYRSTLRSVSDMTKRATGIIKTNSVLLKNGITAADNLSNSLESSARETSECADLLSDMAKAAKLASDSIHEAVSAMSSGMKEGEDGRSRAENALGRIESLAFSISSVSEKAAKLADGVRSESIRMGSAGRGLSAVAARGMSMAGEAADAAGEIRDLTSSMMDDGDVLSGVSCSAGALGKAARGVGDAAALIDDAMVKMESAVGRMKDIVRTAEAHASAGREMAACIDGAMGTYSGVLEAFNGIGAVCEIN